MSEQAWTHIQPLRIPGGWTVAFNKLETAEPEEVSPEDRRWLGCFTEDILYMYTDLGTEHRKQKLAVDLGWYPDGEPDGCFRLVAVLNDDWANPLLTFSSRSKNDVVNELEKWLFCEFANRSFIEEDIFRKNHPA